MDKIQLLPHHCAMSVRDLDGAIGWFERVLGFELQKKERFEPDGVDVAFVRNGDFLIELFHHPDSRPASPERSVPNEDILTWGTKHICFNVVDLHAAVEHFKVQGVNIALGPFDPPGPLCCFIHGPDDLLIELTQDGPVA